ncbi:MULTISPECIES: hypothetical protein [unclassified Mesorhizobium]|uniref:hypothetical protein n=1 Tax=unclassified Mesorhizobium TaxID=325217 RepID=UPI001678834F|nr:MULTISPECIES: hypothetical protein [unclassified Mesorhizobium]
MQPSLTADIDEGDPFIRRRSGQLAVGVKRFNKNTQQRKLLKPGSGIDPMAVFGTAYRE